MNLNELNSKYEKDLIAEISTAIPGVGPFKAVVIAENFDSLDEFLNATDIELAQIVTRKNTRILNDDSINKLMKLKALFPKGLDIRQAWVHKLSFDFIHSQFDMVRSIELDGLDINPILIEALDLHSPREILSFVMYQTVTRSVVTAWGACVEKMVKYSGCEENDEKTQVQRGMNFDLKKCLGREEYYIQIKSGPNTMNVGMVQSLNRTISSLGGGKKAFLGMTYGTRNRISQQIMGNLDRPEEQTKIGRELWDFIAEEEGYYRTVLGVVSSATSGLLKDSFIELIDKQIDIVVQQWEVKYTGKTWEQIRENYI